MHTLNHRILINSALLGKRCDTNRDVAEDTSASEQNTARSVRPPPLRAREP